MPSVEKLPSGKYRAVYRLPNGTKRTIKGTFTHKKAAINAAASEEAKAQSLGWRDPRAAARLWGDWVETWWPTRGVEPGTAHRDRSALDSCLLPKWGETALIDISRHDVKAWAAELIEGGMAAATVKRRVYMLSSSFTAAIDAEIITTNPAARIFKSGGQTDVRRYLTRDQAALLLAQFTPPFDCPVNEAAVHTLIGTGMRWGEMVGLQIHRVDFDRRVIRVAEVWDSEMSRLKPYTKNRQHRNVPMAEWLVPLLKCAIDGRTSGHVFLRGGYVLEYANWRKRFWLTATERAGMEGVRIHDLRHTFASWLLQDGVTLAEVGQMLGHVSPQTTQIYAHLAEMVPERILAALPDPSRGTNVGRRGTVDPVIALQSTESYSGAVPLASQS
jgi:integrase